MRLNDQLCFQRNVKDYFYYIGVCCHCWRTLWV